MAIPGYTPTVNKKDWIADYVADILGFSDPADLWKSMCTMLDIDMKDVKSDIDELMIIAKNLNVPVFIREDGTVDMQKLFNNTGKEVPPLYEKLNVIGNIGDFNPDFKMSYSLAIINGTWTLLTGDAALAWIAEATLPIPVAIPQPILKLISTSGFTGPDFGGYYGGALQAGPSFMATYQTRYGESSPSNFITFPPIGTWQSVTLGIEDEPPAMATHVYYYRLFSDTYRRVATVQLR